MVTFLKKITKLNLLSFTQDALIKLVLNAILTEEMNIIPNSQNILQRKWTSSEIDSTRTEWFKLNRKIHPHHIPALIRAPFGKAKLSPFTVDTVLSVEKM